MPRDSSNRASAAALRRRASSPVTTLAAFSALVAVSVAISSGISPGAGAGQGSAVGTPPAATEQTGRQWSLLASGQEQSGPLVGPLREARSVSPVRDGAPGTGSWREGAGRGDGGRNDASTLRPGRPAPELYAGELPVNTLIAPAAPGVVLSGGQFGWRIAPDRGGREFHNGTDVSAAGGLPVVAALDGAVTAVFWDVWGGNRVEVTHADGLRTTYNHLEDVRVRVGDRLAASEQLGSVGATGARATGPHLHFETWVDGQAVDPQSFDWVDGQRVIPASRSKYSLEVPVPDAVDDEQGTAAKEAVDQEAADQEATEREVAEKDAGAKAAEQKASDEPGPTTVPSAPVEPGPTPRPAQPSAPARTSVPVQPGERAESAPEPTSSPSAPARTRVPVQPEEPAEPAPEPTSSPSAPARTRVPVHPEEPAEPAPEPTSSPSAPASPPGTEVEEDEELPAGVAPRVPDEERDTDGDGTLDVEDADIDGDGFDNEVDDNVDGDVHPDGTEIPDHEDPDLDGDGLLNEEDLDIDGDGIPNDDDEEPRRPARIVTSGPGGPTDPAGAAAPARTPENAGASAAAEARIS